MIRDAKVSSVVDTRLTTSQISGFARKQDLPFLVSELLNVPYVDGFALAPTGDILNAYKHSLIDWNEYELRYRELLSTRRHEITREAKLWGANPVLICSEQEPQKCHRRLAAEYLIELNLFNDVEHLIRD